MEGDLRNERALETSCTLSSTLFTASVVSVADGICTEDDAVVLLVASADGSGGGGGGGGAAACGTLSGVSSLAIVNRKSSATPVRRPRQPKEKHVIRSFAFLRAIFLHS